MVLHPLLPLSRALVVTVLLGVTLVGGPGSAASPTGTAASAASRRVVEHAVVPDPLGPAADDPP